MPRRYLISALAAAMLLVAAISPALAMDPRDANYVFKYTLYPPGGFSTKKSKAIPRVDPKQPKAYAMIGKDGKFADFAQWFYAIGSEPKNFETWWYGYFTDPKVWGPCNTPLFTGTSASNQGHRIISWVYMLNNMVQKDPEIDPQVKKALCTDEWKRAAEKTVISTINAAGMLEYGGNKADMACVFHFIRTKWGAMGLKVDNIYSIERAQDLIASMLMERWVVNDEDKWLDPPTPEYLDKLAKDNVGKAPDIRMVKGGKVLYPGGMFIGWKDKPALHGTWDGLAIINTLFKYHPDPDPASPKSIFYKWNKLPEEKKLIGKKMIILCSRRLWLDWKESKAATWCWVRDGKPADDLTKPSEAPVLPAYDGYGKEQFSWAKQCWDEMFGDPSRNTNDGVQALLAIANGQVHRDLKTPKGQQVPGRYDFDPEVQAQKLAQDEGKGKKNKAEDDDR